MKFLSTLLVVTLAGTSLTLPGCSQALDDRAQADEPQTGAWRIRVEEAQAIVKLHEIRLQNVEARAKQEDLKWANVKETYERTKKSHTEGAIPDRTFREAKEQYDYWVLQDKIQDIAEAQTELDIAKVRLRMVESGIEVYHGEKP